jgi:hypothetical protein
MKTLRRLNPPPGSRISSARPLDGELAFHAGQFREQPHDVGC